MYKRQPTLLSSLNDALFPPFLQTSLSQAITQNNENVIITNDPVLVKGFQAQFEKLWKEFEGNPTK